MPKERWTGYRRFCPLARGLDLIGERWTMPIVQELLFRSQRYSDLLARLPGISSNVLVDRLKKLEAYGLVERVSGGVGEPTVYTLTDAGRGLDPVFVALREWGVNYLVDGTGADPEEPNVFTVSFVKNVEALPDEEYEWRIGERVIRLALSDGELTQTAGHALRPAVVVTASDQFMRRWAAGEVSWQEGRASGEVAVRGSDSAWYRMLAATGYLRAYEP